MFYVKIIMSSASDDDYYDGAADEPVEVVDLADDAEEAEEVEDYAEEVEEPVASAIKYSSDYVVVPQNQRRTPAIMSKAEMTEAISIRATQIAEHNNCFVDTAGLDDPVKMAKRELMMRMCPLIIERFIGYKKSADNVMVAYYEYWSPNEMIFATSYNE